MAVVSHTKMTILYTLKFLLEKSDEEHVLNASQLIEMLAAKGFEVDRRAVYSNIATLEEYGLDIIKKGGNAGGYYIASRDFELPELKLLVDAVQSSKFITARKSKELIRKLEKLTSDYAAKELSRNVFIHNRIKAANETIYYSVDKIHDAINHNRQITFQYAEWTPKKELVPRKNGALYRVSPWALTWDDENYYLVGYDQESDKIKHYRVDKMKSMSLSEKKRAGKDNFENFDLASYARKTFGMYGGRDESVLLRGEKSLVGVILDRFGKNAMIMPDGEDHFKTDVLVTVSPQFFGWVTAIGDRLQIIGPEDVREGYKNYLQDFMNAYL